MPVQTTYLDNPPLPYEGMLGDGDHDIIAAVNEEASAEIAFGRAVKFGTADNGALLPTAETSVIKGITVHSHAYSNSPNGSLGSTGMKSGAMMNLLRKGRIWVKCEDGCADGDRLWVRAVAGAAPEYLGGLNNADDSTDMVDCTAQGVWLTTAAAEGMALLEVDFTNKPA